MLDIEEHDWKFEPGLTSSQITTRINKYKKLISVFRTRLPNAKIGLYLALPRAQLAGYMWRPSETRVTVHGLA